MAKAAKTTTDHEEIRRWAEAHEGHPAAVKGTGGEGDPGMLRLDFPGFSGEGSLSPISWDEWFQAFDANNLALLYRPEDRFNKLVSRETAQARGRGTAKKKSAGSTAQPAAARRSRTQPRSPRAKKSAAASKGRSKAAPKTKARAAKTTRRGQRSGSSRRG
jgi:hypothetical protein